VSIRHTILGWAERKAISDARAALQLAGVLPGAREWRAFLDRLLLWSAAVALAAAAVFFIAYNWNELGRFAKFGLAQALVIAALLAYWRLGPDRLAGQAALLAGAIFLGALLALFGQVYQTGADTWELFANWAALILPWVLIGRFAGLWMLWIAVVNLAIALYYQAFPGASLRFFGGEPELWALFAFNTSALALWELAARRARWLDERWSPRLIGVASGAFVTALVLDAIFDSAQGTRLAVVAYPVWLGCVYAAYRKVLPDLFMLAGACLSIIVVVAAFLWEQLFKHSDSMSLLLIAVAVSAMGAASAWWLRQVAREARA
jgi:uncharacterized membrane protein